MGPCRHEKIAGRTRCNACQAAYMRTFRTISEGRKTAAAKHEGFLDALRVVRVSFLEAGDTKFDGFAAAEWVRKLGLD
jgi:hypothetical protein